MTATQLADIGIAILIDLATRGEIDPWDIQVIDVIDRYLSQVVIVGDAETGRPLSESGQAFLWASMLVLLKADTLGRPDNEANPDSDDLDESSDAVAQSPKPTHLERYLRRRPSARGPFRRPVTLQELIEQLRLVAASLEEKPPIPKSRRPRGLSSTQAAEALAHLAHHENLTEMAGELDRFLTAHWSSLPRQDWLDLEDLLELWSGANKSVEGDRHTPDGDRPSTHESVPTPPSLRVPPSLAGTEQSQPDGDRPSTHDRVGVFWALLLLCAQSKVELTQEEFYQDIKIRTLGADE